MPRQPTPPGGAAAATHTAAAADSTSETTTSPTQRGESRYLRAASTAGQDASPTSDRSTEVSTAPEPPSLTPGAARVLLRVLLDAARQQAIMPPCEPDRTE